MSELLLTTHCHTTAKISKVRDLTDFIDQCLFAVQCRAITKRDSEGSSLLSLHLLSKSILSNRFATLFTYSQPFNEMFTFSCKSNCCNDTFTNILFTSLLTKEYLTNRWIIFRYVIQHLLSYSAMKFSFKLANISRSYARK